jgi:hypothetical protein
MKLYNEDKKTEINVSEFDYIELKQREAFGRKTDLQAFKKINDDLTMEYQFEKFENGYYLVNTIHGYYNNIAAATHAANAALGRYKWTF